MEISSQLFKIMIPVMIVVKVLKEMGAIDLMGRILSPVMELVGLPGGTGLVWATTMITNIYGGMIVFVSLFQDSSLTVAQTTTMTSMMLIAHSLPIELGIAQKAGVRLASMAVIRIGGALVYGWCLHFIYSQGGWLQAPNIISWVPAAQDPSFLAWGISQLKSLAMIFFAVFGLLCLMRALDALKITNFMNRCLHPVLNLLGIGKSASTITIIGMTLGLAYGGGLIIDEARSGRIRRRDVLFSLSLMGLCHSLIEDTLLMSLLGGRASGILWGRALFAIVGVLLLVQVVSRMSEPMFMRLFFWDDSVPSEVPAAGSGAVEVRDSAVRPKEDKGEENEEKR